MFLKTEQSIEMKIEPDQKDIRYKTNIEKFSEKSN